MGHKFKIWIPNVDKADEKPITHLTEKGTFQMHSCVSLLNFSY